MINNTKDNLGKLGYYPVSIEDGDTGNVKYYARLTPYSKKSKEEINTWASRFLKVSEASMKVAFEALAEAIQYFTLNGYSVTLDTLGTFTLSTKTGIWDAQTQKWTSAGKNSMDDVSSDDIKGVYVRFRPSVQLRSKMAACRLFDMTKRDFGYQLVNNTYVKPDDGQQGGGNGNG